MRRTLERIGSSRELALWVTLVAFGVTARWLQPMWNFTPLAAVGVFAGFYFAQLRWSLSAGVAIIALSHPLLPPYASWGVMFVVFLSIVVPVLLGRMLGHKFTPLRFGMAALLPSLFFYVATNYAVWVFLDYYPHTLGGLANCYLHALPFYRWMLCGDLFFVATLFGTYALAMNRGWIARPARAAH